MLSLNFTFWNVGKGVSDSVLVDLIESTSTDILVLAEYDSDATSLVRSAHERGVNLFAIPKLGCERINVFTRQRSYEFHHRFDTDRYSIMELKCRGYKPVLLALAHLPSKLYASDDDQRLRAIYLKEDIEGVEARVGHTNTLVIGDLNMNPFDPGMMSAPGLHSVSCMETAKRRTRRVQGRDQSLFYNPSWSLLGDRAAPPGTFFHRDTGEKALFWNVLDQVVMRPSVIHQFDVESLSVITTVGATNLANAKGQPGVSDHFPLFFSFQLQGRTTHEKSLA